MARNIGENEESPERELYAENQPEGVAEDDSADAVLAQYRADREPEQKQKKPMKRGAKVAITVAACVAIVAGVLTFLYFDSERSLAADEEIAIRDNGTIYQGVSALDADLSGLTLEEARPVLQQAAEDKLNNGSISYTVGEEEYTLGREELGAAADVETALSAAILYGRQGSFAERMEQITAAEQNGAQIDLPITYDEQKILQALEASKGDMDVEPADAAVEMTKVSDEESKITDMEITFTDHVVGYGVDRQRLAADIYAAVSAGNFETIAAHREEVLPAITSESIQSTYAEIGAFSTSYASSAQGRRFNIWKMSDIINGVKVEPGETWSINEEAGPRTYNLGWQGAPGISDGEYKEEAGGGICQVSSTLYNAVLRAELEIVERKHHSWPLDYIDGGLDATISTGAPDFKFKNNYDVPIYIIARADGEDARTVEVAIYGPARTDGYTIDFRSESTGSWGGGGTVEVPDPTMAAGTTRQIIQAHPGRSFDVYKQWKDASGNVVREELYYKDVYDPKPAKVAVGTAAAAPIVPVEEAPAPVVEQPAPVEEPPAPVVEQPPVTPDPAV